MLRTLPCRRAPWTRHLPQPPRPRAAAGAAGERAPQIFQEPSGARRGSPSPCGQQSPLLRADGSFAKGCGQTVEKFVIKACSCSQRGFARKARPQSTCSPEPARNCLADKVRWWSPVPGFLPAAWAPAPNQAGFVVLLPHRHA